MHPRTISRGLWLAERALSARVSFFGSHGLSLYERPTSVAKRCICSCANIVLGQGGQVQPGRSTGPRPIILSAPRLCEKTSFRKLSTIQDSRSGGGAITAPSEDSENLNLPSRILKLMASKMSGFYFKNTILLKSAKTIYECCVEGVNYEDFYEACHMPDTFQSWFLVNQLHVWMCLVRLKVEGKDGRFVYRKLVEIMWQDVEERMKVMGVDDSSVRRESLRELVENFYGLIFAYDEGLLSHDRVLAAALWRNMFHDKQNTDAIKLAEMVDYVRRQVRHLDRLDSKQFLETGEVKWLPLVEKDAKKTIVHGEIAP